MSKIGQSEFLAVLAETQAELSGLARRSESEIGQVTGVFRSLAGQADTILNKAAAIVDCVEREGAATVLEEVKALCGAVRTSLEQRLAAAATILGALENEEKLLRRLTQVMQRQEAVASQLKALSVLTNVVVAELGSMGHDFHLLACELAAFSKSVAQQTRELSGHTRNSRQTIADSGRELALDLPRPRGDMLRIEEEIADTLRAIDSGLHQLAILPGQFKACAEQTAEQITGVVSAIQAHDITRQQIEHVQQSLQIIAAGITGGVFPPWTYAGLRVQDCQLRTIQQSVAGWTSQTGRCLRGIQQLSATEVSKIGAVVLHQERELSGQLAHIERLQQESQHYSTSIQQTLAGLSTLLELVNASLQQSQDIRHRLRFLTFNSIVEANRLGRRGVVVSAIASLIKAVSADWNAIADESGAVLSEIMERVEQTRQVMAVFSEEAGHELLAERAGIGAALKEVGSAAAFVSKEAAQMQELTEKMRGDTAGGGHTGGQLESCFGKLAGVLRQVEGLARSLEAQDPQIAGRCDAAEVERRFSAFYTTEIERGVMQAALRGTPLPVLGTALAGNGVELF